MGKAWPQEIKDAVLADLAAGKTIPECVTKFGVAHGTLRVWQRKARQARAPAPVVSIKGGDAGGDVDPVGGEIDALTSDNPEDAIKAQLRQLVIEKEQAKGIGQMGAAANFQKHITALRAELYEVRARKPQASPLDLPEDEFIAKLRAIVRGYPLDYREAIVSDFCEDYNVKLVSAAHGG